VGAEVAGAEVVVVGAEVAAVEAEVAVVAPESEAARRLGR
jgi:hypothetical protein